MGGQIVVFEFELVGLYVIVYQFLYGVLSFVMLVLVVLGVYFVVQGIYVGVQIWVDMQFVDLGVVVDVDDSVQLVVGV